MNDTKEEKEVCRVTKQLSVNLGNLLLSLSETLDLANPHIAQHQYRTAYLALNIARNAHLEKEIIENIFTAALLHDIGAISVEEKLALHNFEPVDDIIHCVRGELLLEQIPWLNKISKIVRYHHKEWKDWEVDIDDPVAMSSQIILLSDYIERLIDRKKYILIQQEDIIDSVKKLEDIVVNKKVLSYFLDIAYREDLWLDLDSPRLYTLLLTQGPFETMHVEIDDILLISNLYRDLIDFKSSYTATHTSGVSECASKLAQLLGFANIDLKSMKIAGNFHDIGKLIIPNSIIEKQGKLTAHEFAIIKSHTYYTYYTLDSIGGLQRIKEWAAFHHEKLDGSGYPFHHTEEIIGTGSRIMTVADIFTAISEDRPYRKEMNKNEIYEVLNSQVKQNQLDKRFVDLLFDSYQDVYSHVKEKQQKTMDFYQNRFINIAKEQSIS